MAEESPIPEKLVDQTVNVQAVPVGDLDRIRVACPTCGLVVALDTKFCPNDSTLIIDKESLAVPNYRFIRQIGSGGMANVYEAEHVVLRNRVAIKVLKSDLVETSALVRFQQEALAANRLKNPNIVHVYDCGVTQQGEPYMIMDLIEGETLDLILKRRPLAIEESLAIMRQICAGVSYAHENGILHRDLKPSNVILQEENGLVIARVLDFGIAKFFESDQKGLLQTRTGDIFGTPAYMSPEQAQGLKLDQRSDIYSLGCIFYEMLTGQPPVIGRTALEIMYKHVNENYLSLGQASLGKTFPKALEELIDRCLDREPANRLSTVAELMIAIDDVKAGRQPSVATLGAESIGAKRSAGANSITMRVAIVLLLAGLLIVIAKFVLNQNTRTRNAVLPPTLPSIVSAPANPPEEKVPLDRSSLPQSATLTKEPTNEKIDERQSTVDAADKEFQRFLSTKDSQSLSVLKSDDIPHFIPNKSLDRLKPFIHLFSIDLSDRSNITVLGLGYLTALTDLKYLDLTNTNIGDDAIPKLNSIKKLRRLNLSATNVTNDGIQTLTGNLPLERLDLSHTNIGNVALINFDRFKNLHRLSLDGCSKIGDDGIAPLGGMPLEQLSLKGTNISGGLVNMLKKTPTLQILNLAGCKSERFSFVIGLMIKSNAVPNLRQLDLRDCPVPKELVEAFRQKFTNCEVLTEHKTSSSDFLN